MVDEGGPMDPWMHQLIAVERRERWLRAAAAAREADASLASDPQVTPPTERSVPARRVNPRPLPVIVPSRDRQV
jgi:hypothetical protein